MADELPITIVCDLCGATVKKGEHYVVRVDVFADPAMPEVSGENLSNLNPNAAITSLIEQMKSMTADELQDDVHRRFEYRVCRRCQRKVLANPLGMPRTRDVGVN